MQINRALIESSDVTKHFMTKKERQVKRRLCQLLIDKGHRKYAQRFWQLDFNIIDSSKHPDFTAAISFDEATVFISDGFLGNGEGIFSQLDVLLRHEMAHNLMMHQIRLMHVFKKLHANDPDEAYEHIKYSASLHKLLNWIEDFEISNKRYSSEDKKIVRTMQLNGRTISGLITEDHRQSWVTMPLEKMYEELSKELDEINISIRNDPDWRPTKDGQPWSDSDGIKSGGANLINLYRDTNKPSGIRGPIDVLIKSKKFSNWGDLYQKIVINLFEAFKDHESDEDKDELRKIIEDVAASGPQESVIISDPFTGKIITTIYTAEEKLLVTDVLKNLTGNINYNPAKFTVKRKTNSKSYQNAWNDVIKKLDKKQFDDETLRDLAAALDSL